MQSLKEKRLEMFGVLWGLAPEGTLKHRKGLEIEEYLSDSIDMAYEEGKREMINPYKRDSVEVIIRVIDGNDIETVSRVIPLEEAYMSNDDILLRNCEFAISELSQGILSKCNCLKSLT